MNDFMKNNPLLTPLRDLLLANDDPLTEHQVIRVLVTQGILQADYAATPLGLFRTHFLIMNGLYQLQQAWFTEGVLLHISPLKIWREAAVCTSKSQAVDDSGVGSYYLDWNNLDTATEAGVTHLLDDFWKRYAAHGVADSEREEALRVLGLSGAVDYARVKQQYRRLAMACHPDRGGDQAQLQEINRAMAVLNKVYGR